MLPMLLVDVVKFAVGSWSGRSASCASFFHSAATSFLTSMCGAVRLGSIGKYSKTVYLTQC